MSVNLGTAIWVCHSSIRSWRRLATDGSIDSLKRLQDAGVAAVVLPRCSRTDRARGDGGYNLMTTGANSRRGARLLSGNAELPDGRSLPEADRRSQAGAVGAVIASLNGYTPGGWTSIARQFRTPADAIELNVYFLAASVDDSSAAVEQRYVTCGVVTQQSAFLVAGEGAPTSAPWPTWPPPARARRGAGAVQPLPAAPTSCSRNSRSRRPWSVDQRRIALRCAGSPSCAGVSTPAWPHRRRAHGRRRAQAAARRDA